MKTIYYRQIRQNLIKYIDLTTFIREKQKTTRNYNNFFPICRLRISKEYNPILKSDFCMYKGIENHVCTLFAICN